MCTDDSYGTINFMKYCMDQNHQKMKEEKYTHTRYYLYMDVSRLLSSEIDQGRKIWLLLKSMHMT